MKTLDRIRARELRAAGWSIKEIEQELDVARSSVSVWVRDVEVAPEHRERLLAAARRGPLVSAARKASAARDVRRTYQEDGRRLVHERDASYVAGCMLYWAEGSKSRNTVKLTNSDPELLAYFAGFLRRHFVVRDEDIKIACNLHADHAADQREIEDFWLDRLGLERASLRRSTVNAYSKYSLKKRANKLPYGTAALIVQSTRIAQTIYGSIQELGGFDRKEWLD